MASPGEVFLCYFPFNPPPFFPFDFELTAVALVTGIEAVSH